MDENNFEIQPEPETGSEPLESEDKFSKLANYSGEIETGIFNLVITLCQHYAQQMPLDMAKEKTVAYLETLVIGLQQ